MSTQIIKGDELQLFLNNGAPKYATSHVLTITGSQLDIASKDHGFWGASEVGKLTWELTAECLYTDGDYDSMFQMMIAHTPITLSFAKVKNYSVNGLSSVGGDVAAWVPDVVQRRGNAYVTSLTANANTGENATYSITFTGAGPLKEVDNTITNFYADIVYATGTVGRNMKLFNTAAIASINSAWAYEGTFNQQTAQQLDISTGHITNILTARNPKIRIYFASAILPDNVFREFDNINTVTLSNGITEIGSYALASSSIKELNTGERVNIKYKNHCCAQCVSLQHVNYDGLNSINNLSAKSIANDAFKECVRLGDIAIGGACTSILANAFSDCAGMSDIKFGSSLTNVGDYAFSSSQMSTTKNFHFYTEKAPVVGGVHENDEWTSHAFGTKTYQSFLLHNASSESDFLQDTDMANYYPLAECDYTIV